MNNPPSVLITGADKGLGLALVARFLQEGWLVFGGVYASAGKLQSLAREHGSRLVCISLDVTDMASVTTACRQVASLTAGLDALVNNAGVHPQKPVLPLDELDLSDGHLEATLNVNAYGPLRVTQQFLPLLEKGTRKLILNISSEAGSIGTCWRTSDFAYCMSKAALNMQSRLLQNALGQRGFRVLTIHPGWMRTDMGGPQADLLPEDAAEGIFALANKSWTADAPMYLDYLGNPLPW